MYESENTNSMGSTRGIGVPAWSGFVMGALVGAGVALLFAPASGEETRRRLGQTAKRLRDEAGKRLETAQSTVGEIREDAKSAIDAGREAFTRAREQRSPSEPGSGATEAPRYASTESRR